MSIPAGPALLFIACIFLHWKLALTGQYSWLEGPDLVNQVVPWLTFQAREWRSGTIPFWDPNHWGGQSLIGQMQPAVLFPLNWLLFATSDKNGNIPRLPLNLYFVSLHYLLALSAYFLSRRLRIGVAGSVLCGLIYSMSGWIGSLVWPQMLAGAILFPQVILFYLLGSREESPRLSPYYALSGMFLGLSLLGGHHQMPIILGILIFLADVVKALLSLNRPWIRFLNLAIFGLVAICAAAPQLFPSFDYWHRSLRWVGSENPLEFGQKVPYVVHDQYSLLPHSLLNLIVPNISGDQTVFLGGTGAVLAIIGLQRVWHRPETKILALLAGLGAIYALGAFTVVHGILYGLLPLVEKARSPIAAMSTFQLCVAVLAGFGLDAILNMPTKERDVALLKVSRLVGGLGFGLIAFGFLLSVVRTQISYEHEWIILAGVTSALCACVLSYRPMDRAGQTRRSILFLLLVVLELGSTAGYSFVHRERATALKRLQNPDPALQFAISNLRNSERIEVDSEIYPYNIGDYHGVGQLNGYNGVTKNIFNFYGFPYTRALMRVRFYLGKNDRYQFGSQVFQHGETRVYENPVIFPEAWLVHEAIDGGRTSGYPERISVDMGRTGILYSPPPELGKCSGDDDKVNVVASRSDFVELSIDTSCRGLLTISRTYDPWWKVEVDHKQEAMIESYGFLQAVILDKGHHRVVLAYRPMPVYFGLAIAGLTAALVVAWWLSYRPPAPAKESG